MASFIVNDYILQEIDRLYRGKNLDKPVEVRGNIRQRKILYHLNDARLHLLHERAKVTKQLEYASVTVAGVLHDLKTPMALIAGYAECAQDGIGDKDYLQLIRDTVDKLQGIVDSVSVPQSFAARDDIDVKEFVSGRPYFYAEFNRYRELVEERGIKYVIGRLPGITEWFCRNSASVGMYVNKKLIDRVVQNIITNDLRYTPRGGMIRVIFSKGRQYFYIRVRDNGSGIKKSGHSLHLRPRFSFGHARQRQQGLGTLYVKGYNRAPRRRYTSKEQTGQRHGIYYKTAHRPAYEMRKRL